MSPNIMLELNFYPRSPCGERHCEGGAVVVACEFLSTLSLRRATPPSTPNPCYLRQFLSTLSLRRATTCPKRQPVCKTISIHALLAESDYCNHGPERRHGHFYPRSPCGERPTIPPRASSVFTFLSTLSLRRATDTVATERRRRHISIHALLAESDRNREKNMDEYEISIHALLAESDLMWYQCNTVVKEFLSTLSLRRATILARTRSAAI